MSSLNEIEEYLDNFPTLVPGLASVVHGDEDEILNRQNSRIQYPCLWVETPAVEFLNDPPAKRFTFHVAVLFNVTKDDPRLERQRRSEALTLAERVYARLEAGQEEGRFEFYSTVSEGEPILRFSGDRDTGWRFNVQLTVGRDDC